MTSEETCRLAYCQLCGCIRCVSLTVSFLAHNILHKCYSHLPYIKQEESQRNAQTSTEKDAIEYICSKTLAVAKMYTAILAQCFNFVELTRILLYVDVTKPGLGSS